MSLATCQRHIHEHMDADGWDHLIEPAAVLGAAVFKLQLQHFGGHGFPLLVLQLQGLRKPSSLGPGSCLLVWGPELAMMLVPCSPTLTHEWHEAAVDIACCWHHQVNDRYMTLVVFLDKSCIDSILYLLSPKVV